ncbi:MAG: hypothetical protein E7212_13395 [Clostridium sartagoforme]|nr:hypothetical protein [Clostridium sartagoforme]
MVGFKEYDLVIYMLINGVILYIKFYTIYFLFKYGAKLEGRFQPYLEGLTGKIDVNFIYRIAISENADILKLDIPQLNALIDIMLLSPEIKNKFNTKNEKNFNEF